MIYNMDGRGTFGCQQEQKKDQRSLVVEAASMTTCNPIGTGSLIWLSDVTRMAAVTTHLIG